jgi:hypothetical protein
MNEQNVCTHLRSGTWPLTIRLVLDDHLGPTDYVASCTICGRTYLLEMLDWRDPARLLRLAVLPADHAARLIRDLERGSCDAGRAGAEIEHARSTATVLPWLLLVDIRGPRIEALVPTPHGRRVPGAPWRELACDGAWMDYARSYVDMEKG